MCFKCVFLSLKGKHNVFQMCFVFPKPKGKNTNVFQMCFCVFLSLKIKTKMCFKCVFLSLRGKYKCVSCVSMCFPKPNGKNYWRKCPLLRTIQVRSSRHQRKNLNKISKIHIKNYFNFDRMLFTNQLLHFKAEADWMVIRWIKKRRGNMDKRRNFIFTNKYFRLLEI